MSGDPEIAEPRTRPATVALSPIVVRNSQASLRLAQKPRGLVTRRAVRKATRSAWNAADDFVALTVVEPTDIDGFSDEESETGSSEASTHDAERWQERTSPPSSAHSDASHREGTAASSDPAPVERSKKVLRYQDPDQGDNFPRRHLLTQKSVMPSGTQRSMIVPEELHSRLERRFKPADHKFSWVQDPASILVERLKNTKYVARMAKLGDGIYGPLPEVNVERKFVAPPLAPLGCYLDAMDSDSEDEFLKSDLLVADLAPPPSASTRAHVLVERTQVPPATPGSRYSQWPPRVQSPTKHGPLHFTVPASFGDRVPQDVSVRSRSPFDDAGPRRPSGMDSPEPQGLYPFWTAQDPLWPRKGSKLNPQSSEDTSLPRIISTAPAGKSKEVGYNWVSLRDWQREGNEQLRSSQQDRHMAEEYDSSLARERFKTMPMRSIYGLNHLATTPVNHRSYAQGAEPGPEVGSGPLSRHSAQPSVQAQSEMALFQRRLDSLLASSSSLQSVNLSGLLVGNRSFSLLLVALSTNSHITELILQKNNLDDGHMDTLLDKLMEMGTITSLDLGYNRLTWVSASKLAHMLALRPRHLGGAKRPLQKLQLRSNPLGNRGAEMLCEPLSRNLDLKILGLSKCSIGTQGGVRVGQYLSEASIIQEVDLSWNELGPQGARAVFAGLTLSPCVRVFDASHNFFGDSASAELGDCMSQNSILRILDVSSNFLGLESCRSVSEGVAQNAGLALQELRMKDNPLTLPGGVHLMRTIMAVPEGLLMDLHGCTFDSTGPRTSVDHEELDGSYRFNVEVPEQREAALRLLVARNEQGPGAWMVSHLNGKTWAPPGPWNAPPPPTPEELEALASEAKKDVKKGKGKGGDKKKGEDEEEGKPDPLDPANIIPYKGEVQVEFRSILLPEIYTAEPQAEMTDELFRRVWSAQHRKSFTDTWRVQWVKVLCQRYWWTPTQAVVVLSSFLHHKEKVEAAALIFRRMLTYRHAHRIHDCLTPDEQGLLYSLLGIAKLVDLRFFAGSYKFDLSLKLHSYAAYLLQHLWRKEIADGACVGNAVTCWRHVFHNGKHANPTPQDRLPTKGSLELLYVSLRQPPTRTIGPSGQPEPGNILSQAAFDFLLAELANTQSTLGALGEEHFLQRIVEEDLAAKDIGLGRSDTRKVLVRKKRRSKSGSRGNSAKPRRASRSESRKLTDGDAAGGGEDTAEQFEPVHIIPDLLREAEEKYDSISEPNKAIPLLLAVYSKYTIDYRQMLVLLQCFKTSKQHQVLLLKKLFIRIEDRDRHIGEIVRNGLERKERDKVIDLLGILNVTSWQNPSGHFSLVMDSMESRQCLVRLLKRSITGGKIDVRMFQTLRRDGKRIKSSKIQTKDLWRPLLGDEAFHEVDLYMSKTSPTLASMWFWLEKTHAPSESKPMLPELEEGTAQEGETSTLAPGESHASAGLDTARSSVLQVVEDAGKDGGGADGSGDEQPPMPPQVQTLEFEYVVKPEARFRGVALVAGSRWKAFTRKKIAQRHREAVRRIVAWWEKVKYERKLKEMQQVLDLQQKVRSERDLRVSAATASSRKLPSLSPRRRSLSRRLSRDSRGSRGSRGSRDDSKM